MTTTTLRTNAFPSNPLFAALMSSTDFDTITGLLRLTHGAERTALLADTDNDGDTPLIKAAKRAPWKVANGLLAVGADVNASNREGRTALHYAVERADDVNRDWLVGLLIAYKASVSIADNKGTTAYDLLEAAGYKKLDALTMAA